MRANIRRSNGLAGLTTGDRGAGLSNQLLLGGQSGGDCVTPKTMKATAGNDILRISPKYTANDWRALDENASADWKRAAAIVKDRLHGRFLIFASRCLRSKHSGFVVLAIDSLLAETIQQFKDGMIDGHGRSAELVKRFLAGAPFQPDFDAAARRAFYQDIRCGLLHQAEAKRMWLVRRGQPSLLQPASSGDGYIIDVERFHAGVKASFEEYLALVSHPSSASLRANLWKKMDHICQVRNARGALDDSGS